VVVRNEQGEYLVYFHPKVGLDDTSIVNVERDWSSVIKL
jgi:hypothetical protein